MKTGDVNWSSDLGISVLHINAKICLTWVGRLQGGILFNICTTIALKLSRSLCACDVWSFESISLSLMFRTSASYSWVWPRYIYNIAAVLEHFFDFQDSDIRYIVRSFWDSRSILSGRTDLYELRLVRYHRDEEWSPWNCILLTHQEADVHNQLNNLFKVDFLIERIQMGWI